MAITKEQFYTIQPGDCVLLENNCSDAEYGVSDMVKWQGTVVEVTVTGADYDGDNWVKINEDNGEWYWYLDMIAEIIPAGKIEPPAPLSDLFGGETV